MILAVFPIIIDLHLNLDMVQNEVFYFLSSVQAPLTTGEVLWLSAIMQNVEGRQEARNCTEPLASWLISTQTSSSTSSSFQLALWCTHSRLSTFKPAHTHTCPMQSHLTPVDSWKSINLKSFKCMKPSLLWGLYTQVFEVFYCDRDVKKDLFCVGRGGDMVAAGGLLNSW